MYLFPKKRQCKIDKLKNDGYNNQNFKNKHQDLKVFELINTFFDTLRAESI